MCGELLTGEGLIMKRLAVFALAFAGIIGIVPATGDALPPGVVPGPNSITGTVTDVNGVPLEGIVLTDSSFAATTTSDVDGTYVLEGLQADTEYVVFANDPSGAHLDAQSGTVVVSAADPVTADITLADTPVQVRGSISGVVTDSAGTPLAGIRLRADFGPEVTSATDGQFVLDNLSIDFPVQISASDPSGLHGFFVGDPVLASEAGTPFDVALPDVALDVVGTVTDADGLPVAGAEVRDGFFGSPVITGPAGRYGLSAIGAGTHTLQFDPPLSRPELRSASRDADVVDGQTTVVDVQLARAATLTVHVTGNGAGVEAQVTLWNATTGFFPAATGVTDADGNTTITVPGDGDYRLEVESHVVDFASEFVPGAVSMDNATTFTFTGEQHVSVDVPLIAAAQISGTITLPDGSPGNFFDAVATPVGVREDDVPRLSHCNLPADTDPPGTYRIGCINPTADYLVKVTGNGQADDEYYLDSPSPAHATAIALEPGQVVDRIDVQLNPKTPDPTLDAFAPQYFVTGTTTTGVHIFGSNFTSDPTALRIDTNGFFAGVNATVVVNSVINSHEAIVTVTVAAATSATWVPPCNPSRRHSPARSAAARSATTASTSATHQPRLPRSPGAPRTAAAAPWPRCESS